MYIPPHFSEKRIEVLHGFMQAHSFATLVTMTAEGLTASHIPVVLDPQPKPYGILRGHLSRANEQWRDSLPEVPALVIFSGPHHYITPSWYVSKHEHGRVVPTWNYTAVHAYGHLKTIDEPQQLYDHLRELTQIHEVNMSEPWSLNDTPAGFVQGRLKSIVGIEISIDRLEGKWKVSQNRPTEDRRGVVTGLLKVGRPESVAMADLVTATGIPDDPPDGPDQT